MTRRAQRLRDLLEAIHAAVWHGIDAADWREAEAALFHLDDLLLKARQVAE